MTKDQHSRWRHIVLCAVPLLMASLAQATAAIGIPKTSKLPLAAPKSKDKAATSSAATTSAGLGVWDKTGVVTSFLKRSHLSYKTVSGYRSLPSNIKLLVVGPDTLTESAATDPAWQQLMARGTRLLVLEQSWPARPLRSPGLPVGSWFQEYTGGYTLGTSAAHPIFAGLNPTQIEQWSATATANAGYQNYYGVGTTGAAPVARAAGSPLVTPILVYPTNKSVALISQMPIGARLGRDAVAQRLFRNMLGYVSGYQAQAKRTITILGTSSAQPALLNSAGIVSTTASDVLAALKGSGDIVFLEATPQRLAQLVSNAPLVNAFTARGGWLVLSDLTPDGLQSFNKLVGWNHIIRPGELVHGQPTPAFEATSGLTHDDFVLSGLDTPPAFNWLVDLNDPAPFATWPAPAYWNEEGATVGSDHWPRNMVNGLTTFDDWRYAFSFLLFKNEPTRWSIKLARLETIDGFSVVPGVIYNKISQIRLTFDDGKSETVTLQPKGERQNFAFAAHPTQNVTFDITRWDKSGSQDVVAIDNLWLHAQRPAEYAKRVQPLLENGGLVKYPQGKGGILLDQLVPGTNPLYESRKASVLRAALFSLGATVKTPISEAK